MEFLYYEHQVLWVNIKQQQSVSHFSKEILKTLDSFLLSTMVSIGNGKDPTFWKDVWYSELSLAKLFPKCSYYLLILM